MSFETDFQLQQLFNDLINKHRPGTLDQERFSLLKLCADCYKQGVEDARDVFQETFGHTPADTAENRSKKVSENLHNAPAIPVNPLAGN